MDQATHNKIVSFIWGIADDVLRDLFKRGKYPDVILPMCVIRRMDAVLEPSKQAVLDTKKMLDKARITEQRAALCDAAGQAFYNTSKFTLRDLKSRGSRQQLLADFEDYLNGFSPNVQDILDNFKFRNQLTTLSKADAIGTLINKFLDPEIDLSPAGIDNHLMGTLFEELVRKFNEENNEEAGEHWTPRDAVRLMANLVFLPIEKKIKSGTYLLYDCACGTGGMLTVAEQTLNSIAVKHNREVTSLLYGQEINPETYAVCKADMLLKGEGESADHIVGGAEWSTLSHDAFPAQEFDFMLANPPYGKSWKKDLEAMGGKEGSYGGNTLRKAIDYFCHLAISPEFLGLIEKNDKAFAASEFLPKMRWLKDVNDDIYDPTYTDMLRVAFTAEFGRGKLADLVALLSGRNFETRQYEAAIAEESFGNLKQGILQFISQTHFDRITMILRSAGFVTSDLIGGQNAVNFAYILYLRGRGKKVPPHDLERLVRRWYAMSILSGRYTGSPETASHLED